MKAVASGAVMNFVGDVEAATARIDQHLTDIMMAQDFHDLTGQVVAKVVSLATDLEDSLVKLLVQAAPPEQAQKVESARAERPGGEPGRPHRRGDQPGRGRRPAGQPRVLTRTRIRGATMPRTARACAAAGLFLLLVACGGGDAVDGAAGRDGLEARLSVGAEAPGSHCEAGGARIDAGLDSDRDGTLDAEEITSTQYVCAGVAGAAGAAGATGSAGAGGSAGASGLNALVAVVDEAPGAHCASGGKKISVGLDDDADGLLGDAEVTSSGYVCHGVNGADGANGVNGADGVNGVNGATVPTAPMASPRGWPSWPNRRVRTAPTAAPR